MISNMNPFNYDTAQITGPKDHIFIIEKELSL